MAINYTVLKSSIINSSIWNEDAETCKVWITMLAMRNKDGEIFASLGGLAHQSRLPVDVTKRAVMKFLQPEGDSSSRDDGRRIVEVAGGWKLLNHEKIKAEAAAASRQSYMADYMKRRRKRDKLAKSLPSAGEAEYVAAMRDGVSDDQLDAIITKHLPASGAEVAP